MDLSQSSLRLSVAGFLSSILSFATITYFAQNLGASALGTYFLFQTSAALLSLCSDVGVKGAIEKRISEGEDQSYYLTTGTAINGVLLLAVSSILYLFSAEINDFLGAELTLFLIIALVVRAGFQLTIRILNGELRVGETAFLLVLRQVIWASVGILLYHLGYDIHSLVYGLIISYAAVFVIGFKSRNTQFGGISLTHSRSLFDYSKYHFVSASGSEIYSWMDVAIIGIFLTQMHVGAYETAWKVTGAVMLVSSSIATTIFPQISKWDAEGNTDKIEELIPNGIAWSLLLIVPSFFGALLLSEDILLYLFGEEFTIAWVVLIILLADKIVGAVQAIIGRSLSAIDHPGLSARASMVSVILNVILNIVLIYQFGIIGAAVATFLSSSIGDLLHWVYLSRFIDVRFPIRRFSWIVLSSIVMTIVLFAMIRTILPVTSLLSLFSTIGFGAIIYLSMIVLYRPFRTEISSYIPYLRD